MASQKVFSPSIDANDVPYLLFWTQVRVLKDKFREFKTLNVFEFVPYIFFGGGVLYVDLGLKCMGSKVNFVYQGGAGIQYFLSKNTAINLEFRHHHISNAGLAKPNAPINSGKVLVGVSFFR